MNCRIFAFAVLLILACLVDHVAASEPEQGEWTGWVSESVTNDATIEEDQNVSALGLPDPAYSPPNFLQVLTGPMGPAPGPIPIDLGLGQTPGPRALIAETARGLDYNWAQCYLFVRNQIRFTPYRGILRGPERTLLDREGNDGDQAFLLLALLRASGYTNTTTILYAEPPVSSYTGGVAMVLGGSTSGYDAAAWLGVPGTGTALSVWSAVTNVLGNSMMNGSKTRFSGTNPQASTLRLAHFWVQLTLEGVNYHLDPSFKPAAVTPPSGSLLTDMGYTLTNMLAKAGGSVTGSWYVSRLVGTNIAAELCRLSTNLLAKWQAAGTNLPLSSFVGVDSVVPQDLATDTLTFHGETNGVVVDFLATNATYRNALRTSVTLLHGGLTNTFWLDEIGDRHLWLSYTNAPQTYPKAVLHLDDTVVTNESAGAYQAPLTAFITVSNAYSIVGAPYPLVRSNGNVYAIAVGFGGDHRGGMRERVADELGRLRSAGLPESDVSLRSRVLQVLGQQWLAQVAQVNAFDSHLKGSKRHFFYLIGIAGQERSPYVDLKNLKTYAASDASKFDGVFLFLSALEHAALDQLNGTNHPAVSTVRVIDLANATNEPIYFATSTTWPTISNKLVNYSPQMLQGFATDTMNKYRKILLPRNGSIALRQWLGYGYINYGPDGNTYSYGMMIQGGLSGGFTTDYRLIAAVTAAEQYEALSRVDASKYAPQSSDPIDMRSGASLIRRSDLAMAGPMPLTWGRSYDSRARWTDGSLGRGWTHTYDLKASVHADPDAFLGRAAPAACIPSIVASAVVADLIAAEESARNFAMASLVAKWWADQLVDGAVTVKTENNALSFSRQPNGTYVPAPGATTTLTRGTNGQFTLQERLGRAWTFATNGALTGITDPSGNATSLYYSNATWLVAVSNSFGRKFTIAWASNRVASVSDSAGRSVSYRYNSTGCLTGVTDAANYKWSLAYDTNAAFLSEADPTGLTNVSNAYNALGQVTNQVSANGQRWPFGFAAGVRAWECDPFTNRVVYAYDDDGRLAQRVDRDHSTNSWFYDGQGQIVSNVDGVGRVTVQQYDTSNNLLRVTEAANTAQARATDCVYDSQHRLVTVTNPLSRTTRMTYDAAHRLTSRTLADGTVTTNGYDSHGLPTSVNVRDVTGRTLFSVTNGYDNRGFATTVWSMDAGTNSFWYDAAGNVTNAVDALGRPTRFAYDPRGFRTNTVNALTGVTIRAYNSAGRLVTVIDPLLRTNTFFWSAGGSPAGVRYPDGGQTTNEYDAAERWVAGRDTRTNRVALDLDALGRSTRRYSPNWQEQMWYSLAGCVTARTDAVSGRVDTVYDSLDRPTVILDALRHSWTNDFNALDTLTGITDPRNRTTTFGLDALDRRVANVYPGDRTESFGLDGLGRLIAFTNAEGHIYHLAYDGQNRLIAATNAAEEQVFRNFFDNRGNLTNHLDGAGHPTSRQFDLLNRCTNAAYSDGSTEAFTFDAVGNLQSARNATATNTFAYDAMDHLTSSVSRVAGVAFTNRYRYDLGGCATNVVYPDGKTVRYDFDADGRLTNVVDWSQRSYSLTRDAAGRVTAQTYPNGVSATWQYDASHAVSNWFYSGAAGFPGRTILRDSIGSKLREDVTSGAMPQPVSGHHSSNVFDVADRLLSACASIGTNNFAETYEYDLCGALTSVVRNTGSNDAYAYDLAGRMVSASGSNLSLAVSYDALGNRVRTTVNGLTTLWAIDHTDSRKRPLMEATTNGTPVRYYVWGGGRLLAEIDADGTTRFAHCDDQGSVVALTSTNGTLLFTANYGPYGESWGATGTNVTPFGWLGGHGVFNPGAGTLHLTRYRPYDCKVKRFLALDPLGLAGGPNLYGYALGNPLLFTDALGLCPEYLTHSQFRQGIFFYSNAARAGEYFANDDYILGSLSLINAGIDAAAVVSVGYMAVGGVRAVVAWGEEVISAENASTLSSRGVRPLPGTRVRPEGIPENWRIRNTDTPGGVEYYNPRNPNESIRIMQGNPNSPYPNSRAPYARQRDASGTYLRTDGTPSTLPRGGIRDPDAHIPLDQFEVR